MELEEDAIVLLRLDPRLPIADVEAIAARLMASGALTPGFIEPAAGLLSVRSMLYAETVERRPTILLPDRNVVTRMARIAREGVIGRDDVPSRLALDLMAFAQAMNVGIEPAVAFMELAQSTSAGVADQELRWFRAADEGGRAMDWIDLAMGRSPRLPPLSAKPSEGRSFPTAPHRWRCNYAVVLKAASLELSSDLSPIGRFEALIAWMVEDFILAGPAAVLCALFLSPRGPRSGLVKGLRSPDRARALAGAKNAAWDATYLSELVRRAHPDSYEKARCIFASADRSLADLAPVLLIDAEEPAVHRRELSRRFEPWWPNDAERVGAALMNGLDAVATRTPPEAPGGVQDYVGDKIAEGEEALSGPI